MVVTVLSASGTGVPAPGVIDAVRAVLEGPVRPLTDHVMVGPAALVPFAVEAELTVFAGPDQALVLQTAEASLAAHLAAARRLGRDVTRSALIAALHVANVQNVNLIQPVADVVISPQEVGLASSVSVIVAGTVL